MRSWRIATLVIASVAAIELVLLVVAGSALLSRDDARATATIARPAKAATSTKPTKALARTPKTGRTPTRRVAADLPRRSIEVVVLNGNGRTGAAAAIASRVSRRGYRVGLVGNAPSHDYPRSIVMYRRGFAAEGQRLARDLGVPIVSPLDGMRASQLAGAHAVLILGS